MSTRYLTLSTQTHTRDQQTPSNSNFTNDRIDSIEHKWIKCAFPFRLVYDYSVFTRSDCGAAGDDMSGNGIHCQCAQCTTTTTKKNRIKFIEIAFIYISIRINQKNSIRNGSSERRKQFGNNLSMRLEKRKEQFSLASMCERIDQSYSRTTNQSQLQNVFRAVHCDCSLAASTIQHLLRCSI